MLSTDQRNRLLQEMGYRPLRLRGQPRAATVGATVASPATSTAPAAGDERVLPRAAAATLPTDPLWPALLNAAGATAASLAELGWEERLSGPPFDFDGPVLRINPIALRQQPAAKRALWKTLRSLRARRQPTP